MKDAVKSFFIVIAFIICAYLCGALIGWGIGLAAKEYNDSLPPKLLFCIEGKVYEKFGETYATVVPARTCLPVSKD